MRPPPLIVSLKVRAPRGAEGFAGGIMQWCKHTETRKSCPPVVCIQDPGSSIVHYQ